MAACSMLDFGLVPQSETGVEKEVEINVSFVATQTVGNYLRRRPEPPDLEATFLPDTARQSARSLRLPLWISMIQRQIEFLPASEDVEVRPSSYAYDEAKRTVGAAYMALFLNDPLPNLKPPAPILGTDDSGGILISWISGNKYVAAKFASRPDLRSFVYFEEAAEHRALEVSEQNLSDRLRWLIA